MRIIKAASTILVLFLSTLVHAQNPNCIPDPKKRIRIVNENQPNNYTCYMELKRGWIGRKLGTGMLIHPRVVLTAGHNTAFYLFSKSFPFIFSSVKNVDMYFGSIDKENFEVKSSVQLKKNNSKFYNKGYWYNGKISNDFSVIILPDSLVYQKVKGHYSIQPLTDASLLVGKINITGSPGDKPSFEIWTESTSNFNLAESKLSYDLYTEIRNSGSPIWIKNKDNYQVIGVHSRKDFDCNAAVFINQDVYNQIVSWCASIGIELN